MQSNLSLLLRCSLSFCPFNYYYPDTSISWFAPSTSCQALLRTQERLSSRPGVAIKKTLYYGGRGHGHDHHYHSHHHDHTGGGYGGAHTGGGYGGAHTGGGYGGYGGAYPSPSYAAPLASAYRRRRSSPTLVRPVLFESCCSVVSQFRCSVLFFLSFASVFHSLLHAIFLAAITLFLLYIVKFPSCSHSISLSLFLPS